MLGVMIHVRPSEQFEGKEGGLISINIKSKRKQGVCCSVKKKDAELAEETSKKDEKKRFMAPKKRMVGRLFKR